MQPITIITALATLGSFATLVSAAHRADGVYLNDYAPTWIMSDTKGINHTLNGTVQEASARLGQIDSDTSFVHLPSPAKPTTWPKEQLMASLAYCCPRAPNQDWKPQKIPDIKAAAESLKHFDVADPYVLPGCSLVSIHGTTGIVVCVDGNAGMSIDRHTIAHYAERIVTICGRGPSVCGQWFDMVQSTLDQSFNVIITKAK